MHCAMFNPNQTKKLENKLKDKNHLQNVAHLNIVLSHCSLNLKYLKKMMFQSHIQWKEI